MEVGLTRGFRCMGCGSIMPEDEHDPALLLLSVGGTASRGVSCSDRGTPHDLRHGDACVPADAVRASPVASRGRTSLRGSVTRPLPCRDAESPAHASHGALLNMCLAIRHESAARAFTNSPRLDSGSEAPDAHTRTVPREHVGSTAVPGLAGKPVLDVAVAVASDVAAEASIVAMAGLGYTCRGANGADPLRRYVVLDVARRRTVQVHLHVLPAAAWDAKLAFRDALREDAALASAYAAGSIESPMRSGGTRPRMHSRKQRSSSARWPRSSPCVPVRQIHCGLTPVDD